MIIEAVVAIALLATAFVALGRLASSSAAINQVADQRLSATLAAENTLEQLSSLSDDQLQQQASQIATAMEQTHGVQIEVSTSRFDALGRGAIHVQATARGKRGGEIKLHDWRVVSESKSDSGAADE